MMLKQNLFCTEVVGYILYITFGMRAQRGLWYFSFCQLVCLSQLYLNGRASTCSTNDAIHPASNQSGIACGIFSEMSPLQRSGVAIFTSDMKYIPNTGFTSVSFVASAYNTNIWVRVAGSKDANWLHILHSELQKCLLNLKLEKAWLPQGYHCAEGSALQHIHYLLLSLILKSMNAILGNQLH